MNWAPAQSAWLADGRLHLHHGPIDLIIEVAGFAAQRAYQDVEKAFAVVLAGLVLELPALRLEAERNRHFRHPIAKRMQEAVLPFREKFITPMAAVAGAVADEMLDVIKNAGQLDWAIVNNGGDIAMHIESDRSLRIACPCGLIEVKREDPIRGIATSGWQGRSQSLGIADAVTVLAVSAAQADAAATMIANQIDLPDNHAIKRIPANTIAPDSDLVEKLVTLSVPLLNNGEKKYALKRGVQFARQLIEQKSLIAASLRLQSQQEIVTAPFSTHAFGKDWAAQTFID